MTMQIGSELIGPSDLEKYLKVDLKKKGKLVSTWYISKTSFKKGATCAAIGMVAGGVIGLIVGVAVSATGGKKIGGKILAKSGTAGAGLGLFIGGAVGAAKAVYDTKPLRDLEIITDAVPKQNINKMVSALFKKMFGEDEDLPICGISLEIAALPVKVINCDCSDAKPYYDLKNILAWINGAEAGATCPNCRHRISTSNLKFCEADFRKISQRVKQALDYLGKILQNDLYDTKAIKAALRDQTNLCIDETTADKIRQGTISPLEVYVINRYLKSSVGGYNATIEGIYKNVMKQLITMSNNQQLSDGGFSTEVDRLNYWRQHYIVK